MADSSSKLSIAAWAAGLSLCTVSSAGCVGVGASSHSAHPLPERAHDALLVMVPGRGDDLRAFEREGFVEELNEAGASTDYVMVEAPRHLRRPAEFTRMLHEQVVLPARAAGYERIVMAGVSQGGFRVLSYAREYGGSIDGAVVIAPFLGPSYYIDDMHRQGLGDWSRARQRGWWTTGHYMWPTAHDIDGLWHWVREGGAADANVHVAWGAADGFAPAVELLASTLPDSHQLVADGGHEWETWRDLWSQFLRRDPYGLLRAPPSEPIARADAASVPSRAAPAAW